MGITQEEGTDPACFISCLSRSVPPSLSLGLSLSLSFAFAGRPKIHSECSSVAGGCFPCSFRNSEQANIIPKGLIFNFVQILKP